MVGITEEDGVAGEDMHERGHFIKTPSHHIKTEPVVEYYNRYVRMHIVRLFTVTLHQCYYLYKCHCMKLNNPKIAYTITTMKIFFMANKMATSYYQ